MFEALKFSGKNNLPILLQAENSECGLACLAMISHYYGDNSEISFFRNGVESVNRGSDLGTLMKVARQHQMIGRAIRCEIDELHLFKDPVILHWNHNHYVVLKECSRKSVVVHDPAIGVRKLNLEEFSHHFTGVALELTPDADFKPEKNQERPGFADFMQGIRGFVPVLCQLLILAGVLQFITLLTPFYTQLVMDEVLVKGDVDLLLVLALGFALLTLIGVFTNTIRGWTKIYLTSQLSFEFSARLFKHLIFLPVYYFRKRHMGDIVSRFHSLNPVQEFITSSVITIILDGIMAAMTIVIVFIYSPVMATLVVGTLIVELLLQLSFYSPTKMRVNEQLVAEAKVDSNFMETIRTISSIKRYNKEEHSISVWQNNFCNSINAGIKVERLHLFLGALSSTISGISGIAIIYLGATQVLSEQMTIGMLFAFIAYKNHLQSAVNSLVGEFVNYLMLSLHFDRLSDIKMHALESDKGPMRTLSGTIQVRSLSFRYSEDAAPVIQDLNLTIGQGEQLAICGPSGSGKSTLINLMQADLTSTEGEICYDNLSARIVGIRSIRENCASVMHGDQLSSGSIKSNITFGSHSVDWADLEAASTLAGIHQDILALPMAYESLVGEMSSGLSAGQVQRILIARALYKKPKILFLDEGTAHLDKKAASTIMANIRSANITCIFITHQRTLLKSADIVLSIGNGKHRLNRIRRNTMTIVGSLES